MAGPWGAEQKGADKLLETLTAYAPAVGILVGEVTDPCKQAAVLEAKRRTAMEQGRSTAEIRLIEAKLEAEQRQCAVKTEQTGIGTDVRNLVAVGVGALVLLAGAGAFYVVVQGLQSGRKGRKR